MRKVFFGIIVLMFITIGSGYCQDSYVDGKEVNVIKEYQYVEAGAGKTFDANTYDLDLDTNQTMNLYLSVSGNVGASTNPVRVTVDANIDSYLTSSAHFMVLEDPAATGGTAALLYNNNREFAEDLTSSVYNLAGTQDRITEDVTITNNGTVLWHEVISNTKAGKYDRVLKSNTQYVFLVWGVTEDNTGNLSVKILEE